MRRIIGCQLLTFTAAVVLLTGCSNSSSPEVADANDTAVEIVLPDAAEAIPLGSEDAGPVPSAADSVRSEFAEIAPGADSDEPEGYKIATADQGAGAAHEHPHAHDKAGADEKTPKKNGRRADGDDPAAPLVVAKAAEPQDDTPLNNGREPTAKPLPEGQRVAVVAQDVDPESLDSGRSPTAQPGDAVTGSAPTAKPATPSPKKLADLSESIQELDKDRDGQLGLYEWPREKLAEFKTLDTNKDGFLTPAELVAGQKKANESPKSDKKAAASGDVKATEKSGDSEEKTSDTASTEAESTEADSEDDVQEKDATKTSAESAPPEDSPAPATESTDDKEATAAAEEDDNKDDSTAEDDSE